MSVDDLTMRRPSPPPTVLRRPTDPDVYRVQVGQWGDRWYCDPWPADDIASETEATWPSVSLVEKAAGWPWSVVANTTARRLAASADLAVIGAERTAEARQKRLKLVDELEGADARRRGQNVHRLIESHLYGEPVELVEGEPGWEYTTCVRAMLAELDPQLDAAEFVAICRGLNGIGYGGTGDAVCRIGGRRYIVDWKTRGADSNHGAYPAEGAQVAAYAGADYWIVDDGEGGARRMAPLELEGGLIISIKAESYEVYPVDLDKAWPYWAAMHAWWVAGRLPKSIGRKWPPAKAAKPATVLEAGQAATVQRAALRAPAPAVVEDERPADEADVNAIRARWELGMQDDGRQWLGQVVREAIDAGADFRVTVRAVQRRADIYAGLVEWVCDGAWSPTDDIGLRALLVKVTGDQSAWWPTLTLGAIVGQLSIAQAAAFRRAVHQVATGDLELLHVDDAWTWQDAF